MGSKGAERARGWPRDAWCWHLAGGREVTLELTLPSEATSLGSACWASGGLQALEEDEEVSGDRDALEL